jgi:hypothetical protein
MFEKKGGVVLLSLGACVTFALIVRYKIIRYNA